MNEQLSKPEPALKKGKNPSHCPALLPQYCTLYCGN